LTGFTEKRAFFSMYPVGLQSVRQEVRTTVFLDWSLALGAGALFGLAGRREVAASTSLARTRAFRWGLVYLHLGVLAISLTLYAIEPAWMWMYWVDPTHLPIAVVALAFVLYEVCYIAGFALASELERWRRNATWLLAGGMMIAISAAEVATRYRLFHFGTYDEFHAGKAVLGLKTSPFHLEPAMAIVLGPGLLATVAIVLVALKIWRDDERRTVAPKPDVGVIPAEYTAN
jgi:hypothetical protein